ncbi:DUF1707 domain-containing protein [Actinomadura viridis]|uniref:DUF1707 domain-containing protein n=1 Tax=Actinomadura viridis TaxID=58110 RepID=A0A931DPN3_9ACTN|nr:DUF1707 domain-containing protein [Actinomadura viridis]MBG6091020.1 hypothetical protein [Actinomadura viridis]
MTRPDDMRVGDAERDAVTAALHDHFAAGRLDRQELDERLGATLAAKTQGDLRAVVTDLPGSNGLPERVSRAAVPGRPYWGPPRPAHHGHPVRAHRHGPFPVFPLMLVAFTVVAFTAGPGVAMLTVLQIAMLVWIVRAVFTVAGGRRGR